MSTRTPTPNSRVRIPSSLPALQPTATQGRPTTSYAPQRVASPLDVEFNLAVSSSNLPPPTRADYRDNGKNRGFQSGLSKSIKPSFVADVLDIEQAAEQIRQLKIANVQLREERTQLQTKIFRLENDIKKLNKKLKHSTRQSKNEVDGELRFKPSTNGAELENSAVEIREKSLSSITIVAQAEDVILPSSESGDLMSVIISDTPRKSQSNSPPLPSSYEASQYVSSQVDAGILELRKKIIEVKNVLSQADSEQKKYLYIPILTEFEQRLEHPEQIGAAPALPAVRRASISRAMPVAKIFIDTAESVQSPLLESSSPPQRPLGLLKPRLSASLFFSSSPNLLLPQAKRVNDADGGMEIQDCNTSTQKNPSVLDGLSIVDASVEDFGDWWRTQEPPRHFAIAQELFHVIKGSNRVFDLTTQISFSRTVQEVVQKFKEGCKDVLAAEAVYLFMSQGDSRLAIFFEKDEDQFPILRINKGAIGKAIGSGEVVNISKIHTAQDFDPSIDRMPGMVLRSVLIVPLADRTGQIYAAAVACNKPNGGFLEEDELLMQALVDLVSNCLQQFKLLERTQRAQQRNKAISEVLKAVHNEKFTVDDVIARIIEVTYEVMFVDRVSLFLVDNIAKQLLLKVSKDNATIRIPIGSGIAGVVAQTGETINIPDAYNDPRFDQKFDKKTGFRTKTILCMPIFDSNKKPVAVIQLINKATGKFTKEDEELMATFTAEAASALQRRSIETAYNNITANPEAKSAQQIKGLLDEYVFQRKPLEESVLAPSMSLKLRPSVSALEGLKDWNLDHFSLSTEEIYNLILSGLDSLELMEQFKIEKPIFLNFLDAIRANYNSNPYHNFVHAFSVFQSCFLILSNTPLSEYLTSVDILSLLISALCHDLDHPGTNNMFMINTQAPLAILYNDVSVLENHHCALAFRILQESQTNIFGNLTAAERLDIRKTIIPAILSTDMTEHAKLSTALSLHSNTFDRNKKEDRQFLVNIVLHSSDLCNPVLPQTKSYEWASRVLIEFNNQAKRERELSLPVANFMEKDDEVSKAHLNIGFIKYIVSPLWTRLAEVLPGLDDCIQRMHENLKAWEKMTLEQTNT